MKRNSYFDENSPRPGEIYETTIRSVNVGKALCALVFFDGKKLQKMLLLREKGDPACYRFREYTIRGNQFIRYINVPEATQTKLLPKQSKLVDKILKARGL